MCEAVYDIDENYQLELNLHNIRRELIAMLEYYEKSLCTVCLNLKCSCPKDQTKSDDKLVNGTACVEKGGKENTDDDKKIKNNEDLDIGDKNDSIAPPASFLPKPKWESPKKSASTSTTPEKEPVHPDIDAWIEASSDQSKTIKDSIIVQNFCYMDKQKKSQKNGANRNAVDAFFKYFKVSNDTTATYMSTKLATACSTPIRKNYSYF